MGKNLWFDGEFLYSFTIDNTTYSLFPQVSNIFFFFQYWYVNILNGNMVQMNMLAYMVQMNMLAKC